MMKLILAFALILAIEITASAQDKNQTAVASAVETLRQAMVDGNKDRLENIVSDQLSYGHSGGHIDNKKEFVEKLTNGTSDFVSIELVDQTIGISGRTAIVRHKLNARTNDNGKPGEVHLFVMLVFQKNTKHWKLLARQAVKIP